MTCTNVQTGPAGHLRVLLAQPDDQLGDQRGVLSRALDLARDAGHGDVTLHRLRHTVATTLVSGGGILAAQYRLGHRDASTTLRIYSHALPLQDADAAATMEQAYRSTCPGSAGRPTS